MTVSRPTDHEAFLRFFLQHEQQVRVYARTLLSSWQDVDEVMQEASLVAWRKFNEFDPQSNFAAWLATIVRFEALKWRRTKRRDHLIFSEQIIQLLAEEGLEELDNLERQRTVLEKCFHRLSETHRQLLQLSYGSGRPFREIAKMTGYSAEAFYKVLQRLRSVLLKCVEQELAKYSEL
ncbi:MAG: sigma-70 family RNA polymerase sigma factor [Pirellulales bacterium]|nr:sigma-70 family RNA polymerase sigma factor [Pirellulales bacterium]